MSLDFELNLIFPNQNTAIFCRSTLEATRYLIKQRLPDIAEQLSKTMLGEPLPLNEELVDNAYQQAFFVDLIPEDVSEIVEFLHSTSLDQTNSPTPGLVALAKALHSDWQELANSLDTIPK